MANNESHIIGALTQKAFADNANNIRGTVSELFSSFLSFLSFSFFIYPARRANARLLVTEYDC